MQRSDWGDYHAPDPTERPAYLDPTLSSECVIAYGLLGLFGIAALVTPLVILMVHALRIG